MQTLLTIYCILSVAIALYLSVKFFLVQKGWRKLTAPVAFVFYAVLWPVLGAVVLRKIKKFKAPE